MLASKTVTRSSTGADDEHQPETAPTCGRSRRSPAVVVGVHGLTGKPTSQLRAASWKAAMIEGVRRHCGRAFDSLPIDLVYWADLCDARPLAPDCDTRPYPAESPSEPSRPPGRLERARARVWPTVFARARALQAAIDSTVVDDLVMRTWFPALWRYHHDDAFRRTVRSRVRNRLLSHRGERILLVTHSMGSAISYDVLRQMDCEGDRVPIEHFVTTAPTISLYATRRMIAREHGDIRVPDSVRRWTNVYDLRDAAAVASRPSDVYEPNRRGVEIKDVDVVNRYRRPDGRRDRHNSHGYLQSPELASILERSIP